MRLAVTFVALVGAVGIGLGGVWDAGPASIDADAAALPAQAELTARGVRRCVNCGWIEAKRRIVPSAADPQAVQSYEYTLRMTDGSSSVFRETLPASWRLGERVRVIAGTGPRD
jgi:hypothetical protein